MIDNFIAGVKERIKSLSPVTEHIRFPVPEEISPEPSVGCDVKISTGRGGKIYTGEGLKTIGPIVKITADGECTVIIGKNVTLNRCVIQAGGNGCFISIGDNCHLSGLTIVAKRDNSVVIIGEGTTWESGAALNGHGKVIYIGNDCMISNGVMIRTSDGHGIFDASTKECINQPSDVLIGDHVWLGNSSRVNKGSTIHSGSVIGQGSIVSKVVDGNCIYAGIPAKKIKENIVWSRSDSYEKIPEEYRI
ncbi:acyltransferase [Escherichia coli]|uniref:acyltransferase n=1 Tax=Escherichia coli TaxID=562 RepID=UPI001806E619|nr:acyltransferase [Escherichia coli]